jgi:hypothetical protein
MAYKAAIEWRGEGGQREKMAVFSRRGEGWRGVFKGFASLCTLCLERRREKQMKTSLSTRPIVYSGRREVSATTDIDT